MTDHPEIIELAHVLCKLEGGECPCKYAALPEDLMCGRYLRQAIAAMRFCYSRPVTGAMSDAIGDYQGQYAPEVWSDMAAAKLKELGLARLVLIACAIWLLGFTYAIGAHWI